MRNILKAFLTPAMKRLPQAADLWLPEACRTYLPGIVGGIQRALGKGKKLGIVYLDASPCHIETHGDDPGHISWPAFPSLFNSRDRA